MAEKSSSNTKLLFDSLCRLYHQGHLLLMDSDKYLGEEGWAPLHTYGIAELSYSLNSPHKWFARWAMRFYSPSIIKGDEPQIDCLLFVSIHFASDAKTGLESTVDEPMVCAGRLLYGRPMTPQEAASSFDYWMCKYWFIGKPHPVLKGWRQTGQSQWHENLAGSESFVVPLYDVTSSEKLKKMVIVPLLTYGKSGKTSK